MKCLYCGVEFAPTRPNKAFCSEPHRREMRNKVRREKYEKKRTIWPYDQRFNGRKYALIEREVSPEQQRRTLIEQDARFCDAMRRAIAAGLERP